MIDLSIVIVSWNTKQILDDCLQSVYEQTKGIEYEVIVVDNDSKDGSADMVEEKYPEALLIRSPDNVGFAAGNNLGFEHVKGRHVLLLNSDTLVLDGALQKTLRYAETKVGYGVISCKMLNEDHSLQPNCSMLPSNINFLFQVLGLYKFFPSSRIFGRAEMTWWNYSDERDVEVLKGCFMLVSKDALDDVGGMDEDYFMYSEEVDWCKRFAQANWKLGYYPDAEVIHLGGSSAAKLGADRARIKDKSSLLYMKKHWSPGQQFLGRSLMVLFYALRLPAAAMLFLLTGQERFKKIRDNHWSGITGLFS